MGGGGYGGMGGGGYGGMGGGGMGGMNIGGAYRAEDLATLIQETIDPDTWYDISTTGEGTVTPYPRDQPKKLAVLQTREIHKKIEKLLAEMRRALGCQVAIEARYLVVSENFLEDIGLNIDFTSTLGGKWGQLTFEPGSALSTQPDISTKVPGSLGGIGPAASITGGYGSILDNLQVTFLLRATQAHTDAKALTAPKVTVLSGETASFWVLNDVSYVLPPDISTGTSSGAYQGGGYQTSSVLQNVQRLQVGSTLQITPIITQDKKNVLLNIVTELNDLLRMKTHRVEAVNAAGTVAEYTVTVPETEISQVMTRVSVPDGGTLLLGGQKITAEVEKEVGVPVLSKIPVLGRLFSNRSKIKDEKILLILVKPTIILQEEREAEAIAALESAP
jgi:general secretion pathway protein D